LTRQVENTPWGFDEPWRGNPYNPDRALALTALTAMVERYGDNDGVIYGSFNEPAFISWRDWRPVAEELVDAIHDVDPRALVTVSGINFASDLSGVDADPVERPNVVYEIHPYPWVGDGWKTVVDGLLQSYPVFIGEWGFGDEHPATVQGYAQPLVDYCQQRGLGWTAWVWDHEWTPRMFVNRSQTELTEFGFIVKNALSETSTQSAFAAKGLP
jgi:endoglucanase